MSEKKDRRISIGEAVNHVATFMDSDLEIRIKSGEVQIDFAGRRFEATGMNNTELSEFIASAAWLASQQLVGDDDN